MKPLLCFLFYPSFGDCSAGGVSSQTDKVILTDKWDENQTVPQVKIVERRFFGGVKPYLTAYVYGPNGELLDGPKGAMFGGCFVYSSDSRFPYDYPVPLHDRFE